MKRIISVLSVLGLFAFAFPALAGNPPAVGKGMSVIESHYGFDETVNRIERILDELPPVSLMARVDHRANAKRVGLELPPTTVLIFGNPNLGTRLMQSRRSAAIDLPMKMLVWQQGERVYIGWNEPQWIAKRHGIDDREAVVKKMTGALSRIAHRAAGAK